MEEEAVSHRFDELNDGEDEWLFPDFSLCDILLMSKDFG
jgi:hypothetical protein